MIAISGAEGLFSHLQSALLLANGDWVRLMTPIRDDLVDWQWLADSVMSHPTSIVEVVRKATSVVQMVDAAEVGMGRVIFDSFSPVAHPIVW